MEKIISAAELIRLQRADNTTILVDVRRKEDYEKSPGGIAEASWCDPLQVDEWAHTLPKQQEVVIYCVRGGSVSQTVQKQLVDAGVQARFLEGGLEAYRKESE
jgi:rhodanese-related sulfurtransferase